MRDTLVDTDVIKRSVQLACRAPSLHNSQPWRWLLDGRAVHLFVDPKRAPMYTDTSGREALFGCGAALDHFRVALASAGWHANVDRFPNPNNPHHLASVDFSPMAFVTDGDRLRANAILVRRTDRLPFFAPPDWDSVEQTLRFTVGTGGVRLDVVPDALRPEVAEAAQLTDSLRLYDSDYHAELASWSADFPVTDGIPSGSLVSASESDRVDVGRSFPVTHHPDRRSEVPEDHSKLVVLSTFDDTSETMLRCGESLSAVLLDATMAGLATCTLTHITEFRATREILSSILGQSATPQILIRAGRVPAIESAAPPTPRRPIEEVFEITAESV
jgi:hypothetical protein